MFFLRVVFSKKVVENLERAKMQQRLNFQDKMNARRQRALKMMELDKDRKIAADTLEATKNALKNNFENGFIADKAKVTDMVSKGSVTPEIIKDILTMRQKKEIEAVWKVLPLIKVENNALLSSFLAVHTKCRVSKQTYKCRFHR